MEDKNPIILNDSERDRFFNSLLTDYQPSEEVKEAAKRYKILFLDELNPANTGLDTLQESNDVVVVSGGFNGHHVLTKNAVIREMLEEQDVVIISDVGYHNEDYMAQMRASYDLLVERIFHDAHKIVTTDGECLSPIEVIIDTLNISKPDIPVFRIEMLENNYDPALGLNDDSHLPHHMRTRAWKKSYNHNPRKK